MRLLEILQREDNAYSLIRITALVGVLLVFISYLLEPLLGINFSHFTELASFVGVLMGYAVGKACVEIRSNLGGK